MFGISVAFMAIVGAEFANAQTPSQPDSNEGVSLEMLTTHDPNNDEFQIGDEPEKDKWALTDEDRMSDEEMDEELFGKNEKSPASIEAGEGGTSESPDDEQDRPSSESDDSAASKKQQARLAPRQTIETYLRGINTLTVETFTPPSTNLDGVDVPTRLTPPQAFSANQYSAAATLRFQTPDIHHRPLYFEDQNPERYGVHRYRLQPIESARKFTSDAISLPRELRSIPPKSCIYRANLRYNQPSLIPTNR